MRRRLLRTVPFAHAEAAGSVAAGIPDSRSRRRNVTWVARNRGGGSCGDATDSSLLWRAIKPRRRSSREQAELILLITLARDIALGHDTMVPCYADNFGIRLEAGFILVVSVGIVSFTVSLARLAGLTGRRSRQILLADAHIRRVPDQLT